MVLGDGVILRFPGVGMRLDPAAAISAGLQGFEARPGSFELLEPYTRSSSCTTVSRKRKRRASTPHRDQTDPAVLQRLSIAHMMITSELAQEDGHAVPVYPRMSEGITASDSDDPPQVLRPDQLDDDNMCGNLVRCDSEQVCSVACQLLL